jgi:hypothetical protein
MPKTSPDISTEVMVARCRSGEYCTVRGNMSWGVHPVMAARKDRTRKAVKSRVMMRPRNCARCQRAEQRGQGHKGEQTYE